MMFIKNGLLIIDKMNHLSFINQQQYGHILVLYMLATTLIYNRIKDTFTLSKTRQLSKLCTSPAWPDLLSDLYFHLWISTSIFKNIFSIFTRRRRRHSYGLPCNWNGDMKRMLPKNQGADRPRYKSKSRPRQRTASNSNEVGGCSLARDTFKYKSQNNFGLKNNSLL